MKSSEELLKELSTVSDMATYIEINQNEMLTETFGERLSALVQQMDVSVTVIARKAQVDRFYMYEILRGKKIPSADKIVCLALAMQLSMQDTQHLLRLAKRPLLDPKRIRDSALVYSVVRQKSIEETNRILAELDEMGLG